jgi:hypothetical protein
VYWNPGDTIILRGMYQNRPCSILSAIVVQDNPEEIALFAIPGAECIALHGYIYQKHGPDGKWDRWKELLDPHRRLEKYTWRTNHFLMLLKPHKFYATSYIWHHETNAFQYYYVNFQLPFQRSPFGFDTFDLELDIVVKPDGTWHWKDAEEYKCGIDSGVLLPEWKQGIEKAQPEIFDMIEKRQYPLDGHWLNWKPDPTWAAPKLPANCVQ